MFRFTCVESGDAGNPAIQIGSTNISSTAGSVRPSIKTRYEGTTIDYVIVDLETKTVEYKYDGVAYWSSAYQGFYTGTSSETISDLASVTGITLGQSTLTTVNIDVNAAINRINEENIQAAKDSARGEVFSFEF